MSELFSAMFNSLKTEMKTKKRKLLKLIDKIKEKIYTDLNKLESRYYKNLSYYPDYGLEEELVYKYSTQIIIALKKIFPNSGFEIHRWNDEQGTHWVIGCSINESDIDEKFKEVIKTKKLEDKKKELLERIERYEETLKELYEEKEELNK
jgi:hypothetical protein